ncbi:SAM-dependent methyltransferase [Micromonospora sp. CPCC 205371]|nr:SAM-dependent methyltransferase [Micromonospora sp. CPCC 205371]
MQNNPTTTAAEIARLAGVGRAAVSNWRKRHADFPAPIGGTATSPEFDLGEVERWLREQGKLPELSKMDKLWQRLATAGGNHAATLAAVGAHLLERERGEQRETAERGPLREVGALADELGAQALFDELWRRARLRATPDELADLMVGLAGAGTGAVLDPACGSGGILRAAVRAGCGIAYGQEIDEQLARLTGLWLALHGADGEVRSGDSLRADAFVDRRVDAVVCSPPFGVTNWGQQELGYDPRWEYGSPPRTEPELAWVQHAVAHLRPGGRAVLLMPPAAASRRAGRRIRAELLRRGALRGVVALPAGAAAPHGVPLHLWVLRRPVPDAPVPPAVLLVDAAAPGKVLKETQAEVLTAFRALAASEAATDLPEESWAVPVIELLDDEVDLTPARRRPAFAGERTGELLVRARDRFRAAVEELPRLVPDTTAADASTVPAVSVAELVRAGALELLGPLRAPAGADDGEPAGEDGEPSVLTVPDVLEGRQASGRGAGRLSQRIPVAVGDVVVPMMARQLTARVVTDAGPLLGHNLFLLRTHPAALDPWFLAGQLRAPANERQASSLSGTLRFDVRRAQVRRLPLTDQQTYGEAYRRLVAFERALHTVATLGAELIRHATDGLTNGAIRPDGPVTP